MATHFAYSVFSHLPVWTLFYWIYISLNYVKFEDIDLNRDRSTNIHTIEMVLHELCSNWQCIGNYCSIALVCYNLGLTWQGIIYIFVNDYLAVDSCNQNLSPGLH